MRYINRYCQSRKGGRFRPPRGTGHDPSLLARRTRIFRVQGTGELAKRFRPQSLPVRRAPPARPYLTPDHNAWGTCFHVRGHGGERIRASRLESHAAAQRFWFHRLCPNLPPVSGRALLWARRKDASSPRGGAGRSAPTPSSPGPPPGQRANAQSGTIASPSNPLCPSSSSQSRWVA